MVTMQVIPNVSLNVDQMGRKEDAVARKEPLSGVQVEQLVWQQLEEELLHMTLSKQ